MRQIFSVNDDFTVVTDTYGIAHKMAPETIYVLNQDGSITEAQAGDLQALSQFKANHPVTVDIEGGAIGGKVMFDSQEMSFELFDDSAEQGMLSKFVVLKYPLAIHRTKGAYALKLYENKIQG